MQKVLLLTPPFTQLNTPYPATMYLKGYLDEKGWECEQRDLSIELFIQVFSTQFLDNIFTQVENNSHIFYGDILSSKNEYLESVEIVISFLQVQTTARAYQILSESLLPKHHRFEKIEDLDFVCLRFCYSPLWVGNPQKKEL